MVTLTPIQEEHGYVEACVDAILSQKWDELCVALDDVRKWNIDQTKKPYVMVNPAPLAVCVANELAAHARAAGRPSIAIPAERIAGDIYYTLLERKQALANDGSYCPRKLRSDASKRAQRDLAAAGLYAQ
jgi:hypothetical protein